MRRSTLFAVLSCCSLLFTPLLGAAEGTKDTGTYRRIGQQILRDNALVLFPQLKDRLWRSKGKLTPEKAPGTEGAKP
jgi:hypothetical protein